MSNIIEGLCDNALDLFYPAKCPFCKALVKRTSESVCSACRGEILELEPYRRTISDSVDCIAALPYQEKFRDAILYYKFRSVRYYDRAFAEILAAQIESAFPVWDIISWVPVSSKRKKQRGYDQSELVCKKIARLFRKEPQRVLTKYVHNPAQSGMASAKERSENVKNVYKPYEAELFQNRSILLIDDILTTGSTLSECCRVLKNVGAGHVMCAVIAMAIIE